LAIGVAATLSNLCAGFIAEELGNTTAFMALALVGMAAVTTVVLAMPETRPATPLRERADLRRV